MEMDMHKMSAGMDMCWMHPEGRMDGVGAEMESWGCAQGRTGEGSWRRGGWRSESSNRERSAEMRAGMDEQEPDPQTDRWRSL